MSTSLNSTPPASSIPSAGHIRIDLQLKDDDYHAGSYPQITQVQVDNQRPQDLGRLLVGLTPDEALKRIPRLFLLCSQAQQAAAFTALAQAQGDSLNEYQQQELAGRCSLEWLKEHSWQLWQMERSLFGDSFAQEQSLAVTRLLLKTLQQQPALSLNSLSQPSDEDAKSDPLSVPADWDAIKAAFEPLFGMKPREFLVLSWSELMAWSKNDAPYARLWAAMLDITLVRFGAFGEWSQQLESGSLGRQFQQHPLVQQSLSIWGASLTTRTLARLIELARACVNPQIAQPLGEGIAQASRGELKHTVAINSQGSIERYQIDAPTDRYFSSHGLLDKSLMGQRLPGSDAQWVKQLVWAIDPCVEFSVDLHFGDQ